MSIGCQYILTEVSCFKFSRFVLPIPIPRFSVTLSSITCYIISLRCPYRAANISAVSSSLFRIWTSILFSLSSLFTTSRRESFTKFINMIFLNCQLLKSSENTHYFTILRQFSNKKNKKKLSK